MVEPYKVKLVTAIVDGMLHEPAKPWTDALGRLETWTGVSRLRLLIGSVLATWTALLVCGPRAMVLSNAIGLLCPAHETVGHIFSPPKWRKYAPAEAAAEAQNKRFTYWLTFSALMTAEQALRVVLILFPRYVVFRTLFLVWCSAPIRNNGAAFIYKYFQPTCQKRPSPVKPCLPPIRSPPTMSPGSNSRSALRRRPTASTQLK